MLRRTTNECGIRLSKSVDEPMNPRPHDKDIYRVDDLIDACTRPTCIQPVDEIHSRYSTSFSVDWTINAASLASTQPLLVLAECVFLQRGKEVLETICRFASFSMICFASTRHSWRTVGCKRDVFAVYGLRLRATEWG
jgi:hypothetical protein